MMTESVKFERLAEDWVLRVFDEPYERGCGESRTGC
jgi:hypothetical protein